ncbi:MAG: glutaminase A [Pseudomonadota bacterium]
MSERHGGLEDAFSDYRHAPRTEVLSPVRAFLDRLRARLADDESGEVATYIPELSKADPRWFGIAIATVDGRLHLSGDADLGFTIQSVSKPFLYGYALQRHGRERVLERVGVEPTGDAFNSIILDEANNRPFNPMVNAGAIAVAALVDGTTPEARERTMLDTLGAFAGRPLRIDEAVYRSEAATGHRNRAIAYMMTNTDMFAADPDETLDLYFRQCSVEVTCRDLAVMAATLANRGINPRTGAAVLDADTVRDVLTVMSSCGMYNYAGQWAYDVGIPAKSGVSGGIVAVIPGQLGLAVFSPPLDPLGNSVRGVRACKEISAAFGLHTFDSHLDVGTVVRREYRADTVNSNRQRTPDERSILEQEGHRVVVIELQGALFFGAVEQVLHRLGELAGPVEVVILDFKRVHVVDQAALHLLRDAAETLAADETRLVFAQLDDVERAPPGLRHLRTMATTAGIQVFQDTDAALECYENALLRIRLEPRTDVALSLAKLELFRGLDPHDRKRLEALVQPFRFEKDDVIIREGDPARLFFVIAKGSVSISLRLEGDRQRRIATLGPGLAFGEMALLDGGRRSADVVADETVVCYGLSVGQLHELAAERPQLLITILSNLARDLSERLRRANEEIRALD